MEIPKKGRRAVEPPVWTFQPLNNSIMDESHLSDEEFERLAILELQSSDAESSTDDDVTSASKTDPLSSPDGASVWKSVANILNFIEGIGFLALPYAVKQGGILAIVAFIITPVCLWYTGKILIECFYDTDEMQRRVKARSTFKDLGEVLWPKYGGHIITAFVHVGLYVASVSYLILCGSLMSHALPTVPLTVIAWTCIAGVVVLPTTFLKSLSEIAWLSVLSIIALISVLISVLWYGAEHVDEWNLDTIMFWDTEGVSIAIPIVLFGYGAIPILPSVEDSMREKHKFTRALALSYFIATLVKLSFSVFAFLSFGSKTDEVILNNLPVGPFSMIISFVFVINLIFSFALPLHPVFVLFEENGVIKNAFSRIPLLGSILIRVTVVLSVVLVAIIFPKFALILSFAGSIDIAFFTLIFPCVLYLKLKFNQLKTHEVCLNLLMILIGILTSILGVIFSGKALVMG